MATTLADRLTARMAHDATSAPRIFDPQLAADRDALAALLDGTPDLVVHDSYDEQLRDLIATRNPSRSLDRHMLDEMVRAELAGAAPSDVGRWVYFPWLRRLVHLLAPDAFRELRGDRNREKITLAEQHALRRRRIGVVGLSVGQATAVTLALEGVGGHFRLADFDTLGLSNLNRLRAGVHDLGVSKAVLASREMYQIDPYLSVEIYTVGINDDTLDPFLHGLDLLVEECDDLYVKVRLRERARELGIPVVMETSDRGMIDVERFDREPTRPLFHGLLDEGVGQNIDALSLRGLSTPEKIPHVLRLLGNADMSATGLASFLEIRQTLSTWPQLASAVALGGALVTDTARRILLGTFTASGRFYVDLERLVRDGQQHVLALSAPSVDPPAATAFGPRRLPPAPPERSARGIAPDDDELRYLIAHGLLAPSRDNMQPWRFEHGAGRISCFVDGEHAQLDDEIGARDGLVAVGAAAENIVLAAGAIGWETRVEAAPDPRSPSLAAVLHFAPAQPHSDELYAAIARRVTNRRIAPRVPLRDGERAALRSALPGGAHLQFLEDETAPDRQDALARAGAIAGALDRLELLSEGHHRAHFAPYRWSAREAAARGDGVDVATLELSSFEGTLLRMTAEWPAMRRLAELEQGRVLAERSRRSWASASAIALLLVDGSSRAAFFNGGRALERIWLRATERSISVQPLGSLRARIDRLAGGVVADGSEHQASTSGVRPRTRAIAALREELDAILPVHAGRSEIVILRLSYAEPPTARSLRRGETPGEPEAVGSRLRSL